MGVGHLPKHYPNNLTRILTRGRSRALLLEHHRFLSLGDRRSCLGVEGQGWVEIIFPQYSVNLPNPTVVKGEAPYSNSHPGGGSAVKGSVFLC